VNGRRHCDEEETLDSLHSNFDVRLEDCTIEISELSCRDVCGVKGDYGSFSIYNEFILRTTLVQL
jgi:hypothetical protein